jgi:hypothetical protein
MGEESLFNNTSGHHNVSLGKQSLYYNINAGHNVGIGFQALYSNEEGANNIAIGQSAGYSINGGSNNIAIGYNSEVPVGGASNQIRLGNNAINYAGIEVAWTITSDRNAKKDIKDLNLGADFIQTLRPVSYVRKSDDNQLAEFGFIAQEVEQALIQSGMKHSGLITIDDKGNYSMRYNDIIAILVQANKEMHNKLEWYENSLESIRTRYMELDQKVSWLMSQSYGDNKFYVNPGNHDSDK